MSLLIASVVGGIAGAIVPSLYSTCRISIVREGISLQSVDFGCLVWQTVSAIAYLSGVLVLVLLVCTLIIMVPYYVGQ